MGNEAREREHLVRFPASVGDYAVVCGLVRYECMSPVIPRGANSVTFARPAMIQQFAPRVIHGQIAELAPAVVEGAVRYKLRCSRCAVHCCRSSIGNAIAMQVESCPMKPGRNTTI